MRQHELRLAGPRREALVFSVHARADVSHALQAGELGPLGLGLRPVRLHSALRIQGGPVLSACIFLFLRVIRASRIRSRPQWLLLDLGEFVACKFLYFAREKNFFGFRGIATAEAMRRAHHMSAASRIATPSGHEDVCVAAEMTGAGRS